MGLTVSDDTITNLQFIIDFDSAVFSSCFYCTYRSVYTWIDVNVGVEQLYHIRLGCLFVCEQKVLIICTVPLQSTKIMHDFFLWMWRFPFTFGNPPFCFFFAIIIFDLRLCIFFCSSKIKTFFSATETKLVLSLDGLLYVFCQVYNCVHG